MICFIRTTRIPLGKVISEYPKNFDKNPGLTVVWLPSADIETFAIPSGDWAWPIFIPARFPNPVSTGPGATLNTSIPLDFTSW